MHAQPDDSRGELALIRQAGALLGVRDDEAAPFGDDMAVLDPAGPLLGTTDMIMDGVDFESGRHAWRDVGYKAMAVNLSDCAAMGAVPLRALCAVALQDALSMDDAVEILAGIHDCAERFDCALVGGDTNSWAAPTAIAVTLVARPEPGRRPVLRRGARPGDEIFVSGLLGGSILGRHLRPEPRVALGLELNRSLTPRAMIDISDGLAVDLGHILDASGVGAVLDERDLADAIHDDARALAAQDGRPVLEHALHDGEDFELIVVLPAGAPRERVAELGLRPIGAIVADPGLALTTADGARRPIPQTGWEHFR